MLQPNVCEGDRVYVYTLARKSVKAYKLACPFVEPYQVLRKYETGVDVHLVSKPFAKPIRVALSGVRMRLEEIPDSPQQETNHDKDHLENVNAGDDDKRLDQFVEEASQEEKTRQNMRGICHR